ncbi:MAG: Type 1 glutamine amidotransferase-like domain-containing protein [Clostridia bacterium]|nr:Type 1 glutamine amidotransferase-like domain-containing protein [Clostridia bacterium]
MRLILSSADFGNPNAKETIVHHLPKPLEECRVLFFPNEKATEELLRKKKYHKWMTQRGFTRENVEVFDYFSPSFSFGELDLLYVSGGNTFETITRMRASGADRLIANLIRSGVTYVGGSAGAHIVSQNFAHVQAFDPLPEGFIDFNGLGFFDGIFICHYSEARREHYDRAVAEGKYRVVALTNDDSIVIDA